MKRCLIVLLFLMIGGFFVQKMIIIPQIPSSDFALLPLIPLFYLLVGVLSVFLINSKSFPSVNVTLGVKMVKTLLSLTAILLYMFLQGENPRAFLMSFLAYFVIYLVFETWMLSTMNKKTNLNDE